MSLPGGETVGPMSIAPRPAEPEALYLRFDATQNEPDFMGIFMEGGGAINAAATARGSLCGLLLPCHVGVQRLGVLFSKRRARIVILPKIQYNCIVLLHAELVDKGACLPSTRAEGDGCLTSYSMNTYSRVFAQVPIIISAASSDPQPPSGSRTARHSRR